MELRPCGSQKIARSRCLTLSITPLDLVVVVVASASAAAAVFDWGFM